MAVFLDHPVLPEKIAKGRKEGQEDKEEAIGRDPQLPSYLRSFSFLNLFAGRL